MLFSGCNSRNPGVVPKKLKALPKSNTAQNREEALINTPDDQTNKTLTDFQEYWEALVNKAVSNYSSLTVPERVWFNIQALIQAAENGGLISYYYNSGGEYVFETMADLELIGAKSIVQILKKINSLFPNGVPSKDSEERNDAIEAWPDCQYDQLLGELDEEFYRRQDRLEKTLVAYIIKHKLVDNDIKYSGT